MSVSNNGRQFESSKKLFIQTYFNCLNKQYGLLAKIANERLVSHPKNLRLFRVINNVGTSASTKKKFQNTGKCLVNPVKI